MQTEKSSPNTNYLYIWVQSFYTLPNFSEKYNANTIFKYINVFVGTVCKCLFSSKEGVPVLLSI